MKITPMNDPRPGQAVICIQCSEYIYADRETILCDLEGVPFKAYYHKKCLPDVRIWKFIAEIKGYYFWKYYEGVWRKWVFNCTEEPCPPKNLAGYNERYDFLLAVKGIPFTPKI